jgi:hypothetical protein
LTTAADVNCRACNRNTTNAGDKGARQDDRKALTPADDTAEFDGADADGVGLASSTSVADIYIVITRGEIFPGSEAQCDVIGPVVLFKRAPPPMAVLASPMVLLKSAS